MTRIPVFIEIIDTDQQLVNNMLNEAAKRLNRIISSRMNSISMRMREVTVNFIKQTETYNSLINGELAVHFGLPSVGREIMVNNIVQAVANRMEIEFRPIAYRAGKFVRGLRFRVLMTDFSEVLNLAEARVLTEKGQELEWLKWLLLLGDTIIISDYELRFEPGRGRSGGGLFIAKEGGVWRVPPQYAGTQTDNWLTRALVTNRDAYFNAIENVIQQELQGI